MLRFLVTVLAIAIHFASCGLWGNYKESHPNSYKTTYGNKILKIYPVNYTRKKHTYRQLNAILKENNSRNSITYMITDSCGCVIKSGYRVDYKLSNELFDVPLSDEDKFVISEFLKQPNISEYCSKDFLETAKGFISYPLNKRK